MYGCRDLIILLLTLPLVAAAQSAGAPLAASPATAPARLPATRPEEVAREVARAIDELGHPDPDVRERATRALWSRGKAAEPALREAVRSDDPEVARRAAAILADFSLGISPDSPPAVVDAVRLYLSGTDEERRKALATLGATGGTARRPLLRLYAREPKDDRRGDILQHLRAGGLNDNVRAALALDDAETAELLLAGGVTAESQGGSAQHYAAFLLARGELRSKIDELQWAGEAGGGGDFRGARRDVLLAYLHRAGGDDAAARKAAERSGDAWLVASLAADAGDWRPGLAEYADAGQAPGSLDQVNLRIAYRWLARDAGGLDAAVADAMKWVEAHPDEGWMVSEALLLAGRRDDAVRVLRVQNPMSVFNLLKAQGRFEEALRFAEEASALAPGEALVPPGLDKALDTAAAPSRESERDAARAEVRLTLRVEAASLLWRLGEAEGARAAADAAAKAAEELRAAAEERRAVHDANAKKAPDPGPAEAPRPPRNRYRAVPSAYVWQSLAKLEREIGRPSRADDRVLTALAVEEESDRQGSSQRAGYTLEALYPGKGLQTYEWWQFFRKAFPGEERAAIAGRVKSLMDVKAKPEEVIEWTSRIRSEAARSKTNDYTTAALLETLADTLYACGRRAEAEACLEQAAAANAASPSSFQRAGAAAFDAGEWERAAAWYGRAAEKSPDADTVYLRGISLRRAGRAEEAEKAIALAGALALGSEWDRLELIRAMNKAGDTEAAAEQFRLWPRVAPPGLFASGQARRQRAQQLADAGDFLAAADQMELSALEVFRSNSSFMEEAAYLMIPQVAHVWRARAALKAGDVPAAVREARAALEVLPPNVDAAIELVNDFDQRGFKAEADALFESSWLVQRKVAGRYPRYGQGHNTAAWLAARCGRHLPAAVEHATKAVELEPKNAAFIDTLAEAYFRTGQRGEAVEQMKKCLELEPASAHFREQMKRFTAPATTSPAAPRSQRPG
jgi:tetratricopeptide (TPR) repeat protein